MPASPSENTHKHPAMFNLGFRPFFAGATLFAIASIGLWLLFLNQAWTLNLQHISPFQWHAHEMIYGYAVAVIAGFLLTAVKNWTGLQTPHGAPLILLFSLWAIARLMWCVEFIAGAAVFDLAFLLGLIFAVATPIIKKKQWRQMAVLSKLILIGVGNSFFYAQALGLAESGAHTALYAGLYIIIGLILTIGRRIIPLFIERGVDYKVTLFNSRILDISSMVVFLVFFIAELLLEQAFVAQSAALAMFAITSIRIIGWYTHGIWSSPLLWCFFVALISIALGFLLFALEATLALSPFLSVHAFAIGTIGVMTAGMMARVSTGHTGRSLKTPAKLLSPSLLLLSLAAVVRVLLPPISPDHYAIWINLSAILWICAYAGLAVGFLSVWMSPRVDGRYG